MSHVEIPAYDKPRVALSSSTTPAAARSPSILLEAYPQADAGQPTNFPYGRDAQASSLPKDTSARIDIDNDVDEEMDCQDGSRIRPPSNGQSLALVRQTIESQFNLEVLLKHKELRLIDQELAKCQIALEQLRRCQVIPYPAMSSNSVDMQAVSNGSGDVYHNSAPQAPPWGVVNGPYSQHYARWLLQDPAFDDSVSDGLVLAPSGQAVAERSIRGLKPEKSTIASKSRSSRGTNNARLTALPDGYPVAKEEKGPCIVTRSSDGKKVKLVCLDSSCRRSDFNSAQGFINHCRIQHQRAFASHDAAINQCGEEIDGEVEGRTGEISGPHGTGSVGLVHPLVRLAFSHEGSTVPANYPLTQSSMERRPSASATVSTAILSQDSAPATDRTSTMFTPQRPLSGNLDGSQGPQQPLKVSSQTPHLSALLARMGKGGDLDGMVMQAKTKPEIDLEQLSDEEEDEDAAEEALQSQSMIKNHSTRGVMRPNAPTQVNTFPVHRQLAGSDSANDDKAAEYPRHHPAYPSPYSMRPDDSQSQPDASILDINTPFNLSPNTTDPHPAPSLVSDDGDYENMHSESESPSDVGDDRDPHHEPKVMDHDDMDLGEGSGLNIGHAKQQHHHHHHHPHNHHQHGPSTEMLPMGRRPRPATMATGVDHREDERHVSFASPSRELRRGSKPRNLR